MTSDDINTALSYLETFGHTSTTETFWELNAKELLELALDGLIYREQNTLLRELLPPPPKELS